MCLASCSIAGLETETGLDVVVCQHEEVEIHEAVDFPVDWTVHVSRPLVFHELTGPYLELGAACVF